MLICGVGLPSAAERTTTIDVTPRSEITVTPGSDRDRPTNGATAVCDGEWMTASAGWLTNWFVGDERFAVYQDPIETGCLSTYPFGVTDVVWRVTNQTDSTLLVPVQPMLYNLDPQFPACPTPANVLFAGPLYQLEVPPFAQVVYTLPLNDTVCVSGPYFAGVEAPQVLGIGRLGINLDSAGTNGRVCASYVDFQGSWEDAVSVYAFPGNVTLWSLGLNAPSGVCNTGGPCCVGSVGNVDCDVNDGVGLPDLSRLIDHLFITFTPLCCADEANLDGSTDGLIGLPDLSVLISHLFIAFDPLVACP